MGREAKFRKDLSMPGMVAEMRRCFERVEDAVSSRGVSLSDCLMSGLAIFASSIRRCCSSTGTLGVWASRRLGRGTCAACSGLVGRRRTAGCGSGWTRWTPQIQSPYDPH